jgi:hypothetical protein
VKALYIPNIIRGSELVHKELLGYYNGAFNISKLISEEGGTTRRADST